MWVPLLCRDGERPREGARETVTLATFCAAKTPSIFVDSMGSQPKAKDLDRGSIQHGLEVSGPDTKHMCYAKVMIQEGSPLYL